MDDTDPVRSGLNHLFIRKDLFYLITAPEDAIGAHLNVMARLSYIMKNDKIRDRLMTIHSPKELLEILDSVE